MKTEAVEFAADGFQLRGTLHLPAALNPRIVIGCHGLLSDRRSPKQVALALACNRLGMAYLRFDHRGCGDSDGCLENVTSLEARTSDVLHAIDHLVTRPDLGRLIGLFGSSLGGAVCLRVAARSEIAALVTFAAPVRSRPLKMDSRGSDRTLERARMAAVLKEEFDLSGDLARIRNILVVHGEADDVVPIAHAHEIFQSSAHPKHLIVQKNGDHLMSDPDHQDEFIREASRWLHDGLTQKSSESLGSLRTFHTKQKK